MANIRGPRVRVRDGEAFGGRWAPGTCPWQPHAPRGGSWVPRAAVGHLAATGIAAGRRWPLLGAPCGRAGYAALCRTQCLATLAPPCVRGRPLRLW
jgi:hypothetical protein